jgi:hypothetical protein
LRHPQNMMDIAVGTHVLGSGGVYTLEGIPEAGSTLFHSGTWGPPVVNTTSAVRVDKCWVVLRVKRRRYDNKNRTMLPSLWKLHATTTRFHYESEWEESWDRQQFADLFGRMVKKAHEELLIFEMAEEE